MLTLSLIDKELPKQNLGLGKVVIWAGKVTEVETNDGDVRWVISPVWNVRGKRLPLTKCQSVRHAEHHRLAHTSRCRHKEAHFVRA